MNRTEIEDRCNAKVEELLDEYFPNYIEDAAINRPEDLDARYDNTIPVRIQSDYYDWLLELWRSLGHSEGPSFDRLFDRQSQMAEVDGEFKPILDPARYDAETKTLWERITKTNHEDVTYYKGLLRLYSRSLMRIMTRDFVEEL